MQTQKNFKKVIALGICSAVGTMKLLKICSNTFTGAQKSCALQNSRRTLIQYILEIHLVKETRRICVSSYILKSKTLVHVQFTRSLRLRKFGLFLGFLPFSVFYLAYISYHYQK